MLPLGWTRGAQFRRRLWPQEKSSRRDIPKPRLQEKEAPMPGYYVFEVSMRDVKPRIWRRFMITDEAMFIDLHEAIQDACGWYNCHLFAFRDASDEVIAEVPGDEGDETGPDASETPLRKYFGMKKGKKCLYVYDFGDQWKHEVKVVSHDPDWPEDFGRRFLGGQRACPPEDCGGAGGYEECVRIALGKKKDPERLQWLEGWHPDRVDFKETERLFYQAELFLRGHYGEHF